MKLLIQIIFLMLICLSLTAQNALDAFKISGELIFIQDNQPIAENHEVILSDENGNELKRVVATPQYTFNGVVSGGNYVITVENATNQPASTTFDLVLLNRHIQALDFLVYPFQLIAGDINRNNSVSLSDFIMARQLVFNWPTQVQYIGWRYIPADFDFPPVTNPSEIPEFPESIVITNISKNIQNQNFTTIRVGNMN